MRPVLAICVAVAGCGTLGDDGGGGANLPNRGIIGYGPAETIYTAADGERLGEPSALVAGDDVVLFLARTIGSTTTVVRLDDGALVPVVRGDAPSALAVDGVTHLVFERDGALHLATADDGRTFSVPRPVLEPPPGVRYGAPSLVAVDGGFELFHSVDGTRIARATAGSDLTFTAAGEALAPGTDCIGDDGAAAPCWDADRVDGAEVRLATGPTGRRLLRMFYTGTVGNTVSLGFAAADVGGAFSRYPDNPVRESADRRLGGPSNVRAGGAYRLYWVVTSDEVDRLVRAESRFGQLADAF